MVSVPTTKKIDSILTHKFWGYVFLAFIIWLMFYSTFYIGEYPMQWMQAGFDWLSQLAHTKLPDGVISDLISYGIIQGVGGVAIFLPNIIILFFFISLMEATNYMSRVAWLMDNLMHKIGLHGKSFVPMIMGFGCNVPAIMATRSIENKKDRLLTMLIIPFMSCSARLPVYILLIGTFFPKYPVLVLCILYLFGVLLAILFAIVFKRTIIKTLSTEYEILLPQYKIPTWRSIKPIIWFNTKDYLKKIAGIVLIASVIIWFLFNYPNPHNTGNSFISYIGKFIEPILLPLGFDWKMGIGLLAGISAKELIVSTISVLAPTFTIASAASFLAFVLIYFPCIAVFAVVWKESGKLRWAIFLALYTTILAWIIAFLVYNIALWII